MRRLSRARSPVDALTHRRGRSHCSTWPRRCSTWPVSPTPGAFQGRSLRPLLEGSPAARYGLPSASWWAATARAPGHAEGTGRPRSRNAKLVVTGDGKRALYDLVLRLREQRQRRRRDPRRDTPARGARRRGASARKEDTGPARVRCPVGPAVHPPRGFRHYAQRRGVELRGRGRNRPSCTDALAAAGLRYTQANSNSNWTLPSHLTLFTGLRPSTHGVRCGNDGLSRGIKTLAERLRARGYATLRCRESLDHGRQRFNARFQFQPPGRLTWEVQTTVASWLAQASRGLLLFFFLEPHGRT